MAARRGRSRDLIPSLDADRRSNRDHRHHDASPQRCIVISVVVAQHAGYGRSDQGRQRKGRIDRTDDPGNFLVAKTVGDHRGQQRNAEPIRYPEQCSDEQEDVRTPLVGCSEDRCHDCQQQRDPNHRQSPDAVGPRPAAKPCHQAGQSNDRDLDSPMTEMMVAACIFSPLALAACWGKCTKAMNESTAAPKQHD